MAEDARVLMSSSGNINFMANANEDSVQEGSEEEAFQTSVMSDHYLPEGRRLKIITGASIAVLLVFIITVVVVTTIESSSSSANIYQYEEGGVELSGTYRLDSLDDNFEAYCRSLDIPRFIILVIKDSKEMLIVKEPTQNNPNWTIIMETEFNTHQVEFELNKKFTQEGSISHICTRPEQHIITCTTTNELKNWKIKTRLIFSIGGLIDEKFNVNKNVATNKTYVRVKEDNNEDIAEDIHGLTETPITAEGSHQADEDWFAWE